jgi:thymidylate kinase
MGELIIVAGPQAAGKSTIINQICSQYQNISPFFGNARKRIPPIFPLQESRQIIAHKDMLLGAIFMKPEQEREVVLCDLARMDLMLARRRDRLIYLDECNIFTIAHAVAHGVKEVRSHWAEYVSRLQGLNTKVIFLDVPPEVSWERRRRKYEQRLVYFPGNRHRSIMRRYKEYLTRLHPLLLDVYRRLPFPKEMLDGQLPEKDLIQKVSGVLIRLSISLKPLRHRR